VTLVIGGWLRSGENAKREKRAGEGRVRPKDGFADAWERGMVGDGGGIAMALSVAVWVERGIGGLGWVDCLVGMESVAMNTEGAIAFCGSRSVVFLGFSCPKGGISSSGNGTSVLVGRHRVGRCGLRVQHRVRREAMKAKAMVRRTVVRIIVRLRFPGD
jgi:hypothetical protein